MRKTKDQFGKVPMKGVSESVSRTSIKSTDGTQGGDKVGMKGKGGKNASSAKVHKV